MNYTEEELIQKYIQTIPSKYSETKKLFVIGFVGLIGSGKSYVAKKISENLSLYIASNDKIRRFLNKLGYEGDSPVQKTMEKIAESSSKHLFERKMSHIIDADLIWAHVIANNIAEQFDANLYIIHISCPEAEIIKRLEKRSTEGNLSRAGKERYFERKEIHSTHKHPGYFYKIDSSKNVDEQIEKLISKLKKVEALEPLDN